MAYGVCRYEKRHKTDVSGIQYENNREKESACTNKTDWSRTKDNVALMYSDNWHRSINEILAREGIKARKDSVVMMDTIYTASPEFFEGKSKDEQIEYFRDCLKWHGEHLGETFSAVIHFDEDTPHMHVCSVPIVEKSDGSKALSAKILVGNKGKMQETQRSFYADVCREWGLDEPQHRVSNQELKKHRDSHEYNAQKAAEKAAEARREAEKGAEHVRQYKQAVKQLRTEEGREADIIKELEETKAGIAADTLELEALRAEKDDLIRQKSEIRDAVNAYVQDLDKLRASLEIDRVLVDPEHERVLAYYGDDSHEYIPFAQLVDMVRSREVDHDLQKEDPSLEWEEEEL